MKKIINKIVDYLIQKNNKKISKQWDDYCFLQELCITNGTLDINKYDRLLSMVKRKYK